MNNHHLANKPEEILDLVDQNDEIIGEVIRKDANNNPKLTHREVGVIIIDQNNKILLQKRSQYKTVFPGMWSITAGHILKGENPDQTAHTELKEELGFDTKLVFLDKEFHKYNHETHFMYYYLGKYNGEEIELEQAEVEKVNFFSENGIEELIKSGQEVNQIHLPIIKKIFNQEYQKQFNKLS
ncbi:MAG: NUDIX domain-containing protein [Candidatus Pacebacteria bacterium]|nr:NUDIX domain-containing protein [Candidatus Paceibacterota bacterium]